MLMTYFTLRYIALDIFDIQWNRHHRLCRPPNRGEGVHLHKEHGTNIRGRHGEWGQLVINLTPWSSLQYYSMDCYFRQYWRDTRLSFQVLQSSEKNPRWLSFQGLKMNSNQLHINQVRLAPGKHESQGARNKLQLLQAWIFGGFWISFPIFN